MKTISFPHHQLLQNEERGHVQVIQPEHYFELSKSREKVIEGLRSRSIERILLIHGTFAGDDVAGLFRAVAKVSPELSRSLRVLKKKGTDSISGSQGNFPPSYVETLNQYLQQDSVDAASTPILAEALSWSGENRHLGRLLGAISLASKLREIHRTMTPTGRVLILAHSHGGNLVAMLSLLMLADTQMLQLLEKHFPQLGEIGKGKESSSTGSHLHDLLHPKYPRAFFDVLTLGTPLRYRWGMEHVGNLCHLINHQVARDESPCRAEILSDPCSATLLGQSGDIIQQLGIGGSDFPPSLFTLNEWSQERRLAALFESSVRRGDYFTKLQQGRRESSDGSTMLLDYSKLEPKEAMKLFGHGVYTLKQLIPLHLLIATLGTPSATKQQSPLQ